jgi:hypothetical protein
MPSPDPTAQEEEDIWETVGEVVRSTSPPPATEDIVPEGAHEQTAAVEPQPSIEEVHDPPVAAAVGVERPEERVEEPPVDAGTTGEPDIVDIVRLLGAPTITVVRSTL